MLHLMYCDILMYCNTSWYVEGQVRVRNVWKKSLLSLHNSCSKQTSDAFPLRIAFKLIPSKRSIYWYSNRIIAHSCVDLLHWKCMESYINIGICGHIQLSVFHCSWGYEFYMNLFSCNVYIILSIMQYVDILLQLSWVPIKLEQIFTGQWD